LSVLMIQYFEAADKLRVMHLNISIKVSIFRCSFDLHLIFTPAFL
jgi:hypothetical protein